MKIKELIKKLQTMDQEAEVVTAAEDDINYIDCHYVNGKVIIDTLVNAILNHGFYLACYEYDKEGWEVSFWSDYISPSYLYLENGKIKNKRNGCETISVEEVVPENIGHLFSLDEPNEKPLD